MNHVCQNHEIMFRIWGWNIRGWNNQGWKQGMYLRGWSVTWKKRKICSKSGNEISGDEKTEDETIPDENRGWISGMKTGGCFCGDEVPLSLEKGKFFIFFHSVSNIIWDHYWLFGGCTCAHFFCKEARDFFLYKYYVWHQKYRYIGANGS